MHDMQESPDHPTAPPSKSLPGGDGAPGPATVPPQPGDSAFLREEVETWVNEGGAGDEPGP